jgi:uncharacterized protein (DUF1501 family)
MQHCHLNVISRRSFLSTASKAGIATALATLVDIPFVIKRALAEGTIGQGGGANKKKLLFIWLRGANDALNSVVPVLDGQYYPSRPTSGIGIPKDGPDSNYSASGACFDATQFSDLGGTLRTSADDTYSYDSAIPLGNGFAALHPSLKFLAPLYNASTVAGKQSGDLALIHRVAYPRQSRSHFDSQRYWENGKPGVNIASDGIFYRMIYESGLANTAPLTGVSIQSSLPLILRGSEAAMTNLSDPTRYALLGVPTPTGDPKSDAALFGATQLPFPSKMSRELLRLQYGNLQQTLGEFAAIDFTEGGNTFRDNAKTDGDTDWRPVGAPVSDSQGYYLFPTNSEKNGGWRRPNGAAVFNKYAVPTGLHGFFNSLKSAALVLNNTDAFVAGTEYGGFDTHANQGGVTGAHANLNRGIGWAYYALRKYFTLFSNRCKWENLIVVTLSEFGRTTVQNADIGTDHAEAGVMWVGGGSVNGYNPGISRSGVFNCHPSEIPGDTGTENRNWFRASDSRSAMFGVSNGYLRRNTDYRCVLGELIRKHMGATQGQVDRIIPGYPAESLLTAGLSTVDGTWHRGEVGFL